MWVCKYPRKLKMCLQPTAIFFLIYKEFFCAFPALPAVSIFLLILLCGVLLSPGIGPFSAQRPPEQITSLRSDETEGNRWWRMWGCTVPQYTENVPSTYSHQYLYFPRTWIFFIFLAFPGLSAVTVPADVTLWCYPQALVRFRPKHRLKIEPLSESE